MSPDYPIIGACLIVKNEAHVIERCLDSLADVVDAVFVSDTGSTDHTPYIIRRWLRSHAMPGDVVDDPWFDFGHNRTVALDRMRAMYGGIDYAMMMDADDVLVVEDRDAFMASLGADYLDVEFRLGGIVYRRPQICRLEMLFCYRGVIHEFMQPPPGATRGHAQGVYIKASREGGRSADPDKYRKDAALIERALEGERDPFMRSRYTFYLGQSYRDCGEKEKAIEAYLRRTDMGHWQEEVFVSYLNAARLMEQVKRPSVDVIATYLAASTTCPTRAEADYSASRYCRALGETDAANYLANRGAEIPKPASGLFLEPWVYDVGLPREVVLGGGMPNLGGSYLAHTTEPERFPCCPVCGCEDRDLPRPELLPHPYARCTECGLYYQPHAPEKVFDNEITGDPRMSQADRKINMALARTFYHNHVQNAFIGQPLSHVDIGSKYPYFGHCLKAATAVDGRALDSYGIDGMPESLGYGRELGVNMIIGDFEDRGADFSGICEGGFSVVTMIHCLEHFYDPIAALARVRGMMADDGVLFIRVPDSDAQKIDRDFTPGHYEIHPTIWCESAFRAALDEFDGAFELYETYRVGHCRDFLLRAAVPSEKLVNVLRPGAIGDVIATSAVTAQLGDAGKVVRYYTAWPDVAALLPGVTSVHSSGQWDRRSPGKDLHLIGYPISEGYPEKPMQLHIMQYFCNQSFLPWRIPALREDAILPNGITIMGPFVTLHPSAGWSVYKEWPFDRWAEIVKRIQDQGVSVVQLGLADDQLVDGVEIDMRGRTTIAQAAWLIRESALHVGIDSFSNHVAGALQHPAVILFGSTSPVGSGYMTATNLWLGAECSPCYRENPKLSAASRGPCINPPGQDYEHPRHACMAQISVGLVWDAIAWHLDEIVGETQEQRVAV